MNTRLLTHDDLHHIRSCIEHHTIMYGIKFSHEETLEKIVNLMKEETVFVYGSFVNDECVGICTQRFWRDFPGWVFSNVFIKYSNVTALLPKDEQFNVVVDLLSSAMKRGEARGVYDFYYVTRDNEKHTKHKQGSDFFTKNFPHLRQNYVIQDLHFLKSPEDMTWPYLTNIVGVIGLEALKNGKTLMVRRCILVNRPLL